jgi:hypothetical protein
LPELVRVVGTIGSSPAFFVACVSRAARSALEPLSLQLGPEARRGERHLAQAYAGGVEDRIGYGRRARPNGAMPIRRI